MFSALPLRESYEESSRHPKTDVKTLDILYRSLGRLLRTDRDSDIRWLLNLEEDHKEAPWQPEREVYGVALPVELGKWMSDREKGKALRNPAGSGPRANDGFEYEMELEKRAPSNANVLMCLLCSQNTHLCDARRLVRACYPRGRSHRTE